MTDRKKLYFLPLIDEALGSHDSARALKEAFKKIHELGMTKEYKEGFLQFQAFMKTIVESHISDSSEREQTIRDAIYRLLYDLVTDSYDGFDKEKNALIESFTKNENWRSEYERIKTELTDFMEPHPQMGIEVMKDGEMIASFAATAVPINLMNVEPGQYTVRLSNGRVLWEGELTRKHLLLMDAYEDKDLDMAAKTGDEVEPTKSESLLAGELVMKVFLGLESGEIHFGRGEKK